MDAASIFFKTITAYQVSAAAVPERMKAWQDDQRLDLRLPLHRHEKEIASLLREYHTWARHHRGGDLGFFKTQENRIPFFDDLSVAQIRKKIKRGARDPAPARENGSHDLYPGVFLLMAQDLDEKNREIFRDLTSHAVREHAFMKALKGDDALEMPGDGGPGTPIGEGDVYMIPERMAAWARIMLADGLRPPMLVTSHPAVLDDLVERAVPDSQPIQFLQTVRAPVVPAGHLSQCQADMAAFINDISGLSGIGDNSWPQFEWHRECMASGAALSLYVIPGLAPRTLLTRYVASQGPAAALLGNQDGDGTNNTVVGVLTP
jgi:hypothetical protein